MRKILAAMAVLVCGFGVLVAEEFGGTIKKVDGDKITVQKRGAKKGEKGEEVTLTVAKDAKITKGKFNKEEKKVEPGEALEGGLKNEVFSKEVNARITEDGGKVTAISVFQFGKKKKE
ncbi:MAG: hypothetical protein K2X38_17835 [Gemmataceae bacterium]|nr:hypothetical protein [Gemmataceae bacterium]